MPDPQLRSLDALHLDTAVRVDATAVVAYDHRLLEAARGLRLDTCLRELARRLEHIAGGETL